MRPSLILGSVRNALRPARRPSGWTAEAVQRVLAQQASRQARRAAADAVLFNDDLPLDELRTQVQQLWTLWFGNPRRP